MAKLWNIPVVFICENNQYGMGTSQDRAAASTTFYTRGDYVPGIQVSITIQLTRPRGSFIKVFFLIFKIDGMDVLAVREATKFALDYCPEKGPLVFEMVTNRYHGHSMSDPGTSYRTREEIQEVRQTRDPIIGWKERLVASGLADADELKQTEKEVRAAVDADVKKAKADGEIDAGELYNDVYQNFMEGKIRGLVPWERYGAKRYKWTATLKRHLALVLYLFSF